MLIEAIDLTHVSEMGYSSAIPLLNTLITYPRAQTVVLP